MTELSEMLRRLDVTVRPSRYVFAETPHGGGGAIASAEAVVVEEESTTLVLTEHAAAAHGLDSGPRFSWLTLTVHSSLEAVGLTAAFSTALAVEGISCNVLAGHRHDHLLVPVADADRAVAVLRGLSAPGGR
ncbi:ACT domain-containing protein [Mycetocola reblochoni]|nr:ACT domain-containing protein [Mycetocola reblochoni]